MRKPSLTHIERKTLEGLLTRHGATEVIDYVQEVEAARRRTQKREMWWAKAQDGGSKDSS